MQEEKTEIVRLREEMESLKQKLFIHTAVIVALCAFHDTTVEELMSRLAQDRYDPSTYKMFKGLAKQHDIDFDEFFDAIEELNAWWPFKDTTPKKQKEVSKGDRISPAWRLNVSRNLGTSWPSDALESLPVYPATDEPRDGTKIGKFEYWLRPGNSRRKLGENKRFSREQRA